MELDDHYSSSTNPHRALLVVCTLLVVGLSFGLYMGWARYFRLRVQREEWARSGQVVERTQQERAALAASVLPGTEAAPAQPSLSDSLRPTAAPASAAMAKGTASSVASLADLAAPQTILDGFVTPEPISGPVPEPLITEGAAVLQQFWHAKDWKEKATHVWDSERVAPLMQTYYEQRKGAEPISGLLIQSARFRLRQQEVLLLVHTSTRPGDKIELALLRDATGKLRLDWESYIGWGDKDFPSFKKERSTQDTILRVFVSRGSYYNYEFTEDARYLSVQLFSPDMLSTVHAYCERSSAVGIALEEIFARNQSTETALIVRVAFPEKAQSDHVVLLKGLVSDRWIITH